MRARWSFGLSHDSGLWAEAEQLSVGSSLQNRKNTGMESGELSGRAKGCKKLGSGMETPYFNGILVVYRKRYVGSLPGLHFIPNKFNRPWGHREVALSIPTGLLEHAVDGVSTGGCQNERGRQLGRPYRSWPNKAWQRYQSFCLRELSLSAAV
jgi:hypothetical protein